MELDELIRTRRTQKAYEPGPVDRETLDELFELARWAPNHHLTNPWRFRVLGLAALEALKAAAGPENAAKLDRAVPAWTKVQAELVDTIGANRWVALMAELRLVRKAAAACSSRKPAEA